MALRHWLWNLLFPKTNVSPQTHTASKINIAEMQAHGDVAGLIDALKMRDYTIQGEVIHALIALGDITLEPLIALLDSGEVPRSTVAAILATSRDTRAIESLCRLLNDDDGYVQIVADRALEDNPDARAVAPLIQAAQDPKATGRVQAALAYTLYQTADKVPTEVLRQAVQLNDTYVLIFAQVDTSCTFRTYNVTREEADFTQIKQIARQELIRRGLEA
jgi:HEAT repeat protein